jgi:FkbM family methyltransferase
MIGPIRALAARAGYVLWKRDYMRFGIDVCLDVRRLAVARGQAINTIFDVGAHYGEMRTELRQEFPRADIHSFEPHPESFRKLSSTADTLGGLHNLAMGDQSARLPLHVYGAGGTGSTMDSLEPNAGFALRTDFPVTTIEVECTTLDSFCARQGIERVDMLKIDVEGHDLAVMRGAQAMLASGQIGFVYAEFNDLLDRDGVGGGSLMPMAQLLAPLGFRYVATYTDRIEPALPIWVSANVLFAYDR